MNIIIIITTTVIIVFFFKIKNVDTRSHVFLLILNININY